MDVFAAGPGWRSPTSRSSPTSSWPRCRTCRKRNLAVELLRKLFEGRARGPPAERTSSRARSFAEMLEQTIRRYQSRAVESRAGDRGADRPGPGDAGGDGARQSVGAVGGRARLLRRPSGSNDSAVQVLGDEDPARPSPASWSRRCATQRDHRLDAARETCAAHLRRLVRRRPAQARLSAGQAGIGDADGAGAGGGACPRGGRRPDLRGRVSINNKLNLLDYVGTLMISIRIVSAIHLVSDLVHIARKEMYAIEYQVRYRIPVGNYKTCSG